MDTEAAPTLPSGEKGFNSAEAPHRSNKRALRETHQDDIMSAQVEIWRTYPATPGALNLHQLFVLCILRICVKILGNAAFTTRPRATHVYLTVAAHVCGSKCAKITYDPSKPID